MKPNDDGPVVCLTCEQLFKILHERYLRRGDNSVPQKASRSQEDMLDVLRKACDKWLEDKDA